MSSQIAVGREANRLCAVMASCTLHRLGLLTCAGLELTSETLSPFTYISGTLWMGDTPITKSPPTQDNTI
jgi:hypothetical protein